MYIKLSIFILFRGPTPDNSDVLDGAKCPPLTEFALDLSFNVKNETVRFLEINRTNIYRNVLLYIEFLLPVISYITFYSYIISIKMCCIRIQCHSLFLDSSELSLISFVISKEVLCVLFSNVFKSN